MTQLVVKQLSVKAFSGNILNDISAFFSGGLHYIVGLNGSGKSTFLKCLNQSIDFEGDILIDNVSVRQISTKELAKKIAFVPQHLALNFPISVAEFVLSGRFPYLSWLGNYTKEDNKLVMSNLERLNILHLQNRKTQTLSGGELQKVYIARALTQSTPLILLDEPAQSLDPLNKAFLYDLLWELVAEGKHILCTTHDLEAISQPKAQIWGMKKGEFALQMQGGEDLKAILFEKIYKE
jgi:ABC-type cobalamin/Fe3+-siderophores transport system ATPase subunit